MPQSRGTCRIPQLARSLCLCQFSSTLDFPTRHASPISELAQETTASQYLVEMCVRKPDDQIVLFYKQKGSGTWPTPQTSASCCDSLFLIRFFNIQPRRAVLVSGQVAGSCSEDSSQLYRNFLSYLDDPVFDFLSTLSFGLLT